MKLIKHIITLFALAVATTATVVDAAPFENITLHKLSSVKGYMPSTTYTMVIDKYGFSWIGSRDGLFRYDGYDVVPLVSFNPMGAMSNVWNVLEDDDRLIIRSTEGMFTLDINSYDLTPFPEFANVNLKHMCKRGDSGFFFGTDSGLIELNDDLEVVRTIDASDGLSSDVVRSVYEDNDGNLWIGTYDGLNKIDAAGSVSKYSFLSDEAGNDLILSISPNSVSDDTTLWIGSGTGLVKFNRVSGEYKKWSSHNSSMSNSAIKPLSRVGDKLWLGTDMGLNVFDIESETFKPYLHNPNEVYSLCANQVHKIWTDSSNVTWIVTKNGINYVNHKSRHVRHVPIMYMEGNMLTSTTMNTTAGTLDNGMWVTTNEGLYYYDDELQLDEDMSTIATNTLPSKTCGAIVRDRFGRLWVGTLNGLAIFDPQQGSSIIISSETTDLFESNYVSCILNDNKGGMYVSEWRSGIFRISEDYGLSGARSEEIVKVCEYSSARIAVLNDWLWVGRRNMLVKIATDSSSEISIDPVNELLNGESIEALFIHDGVIYCGTKGAIITYDIESNSCRRIEMVKPDRYVINVSKDMYGNIWASDDRVLFRITSSGRVILFPINAYSTMQIITPNSSRMLNNGDIAFGGDNGFIVFSPDKMVSAVNENKAVITYVEVNNDRRYIDEGSKNRRVVLNHDEHNLSIGFTSLDYTNTRLSNYRYRLVGIDKEWNYITSERNFAIYTSLPAGDYRFELYCDNALGEWVSEPTTIDVEVKSHILLSRLFIVIYIVSTILVIFAIVHFYLKHYKLISDLKISTLEKDHMQEMAQSKASFFTNLSHEIRTPLNLITPTIKRVLNDSSIGEENHKLLSLAEENSNRLLRLLNQLLDFRDAQNGDKSPMRVRRQDLKQIVKAIFATYQNQADESKIDYRLTLDDALMIFYFDRDKMESIIYNLLSNAFKYTPREGKISVDLSADDGEVLIEVRNSGVGIAEEEIPHIFEKFYRAEYFRDKSEGAGIGLSIVSEFVELHGGSIEVESILNDHTTFRVTIPMVEAQSELKSGELKEERLRVIEEFEDAVNQRDNKQKILYVDDNTQILEMVSIILSGDYTVITATDGQDGFEKCKRYRPDIVITDIMMPGSDGIELCKKIKSTPQVNSTPIIAMTAKSQVDDQIVGVNAGIDAYLTKPINVELIHATIEQMLRRGEEQKRQMKQLNVFDESELKSQDKILMDSIMEVIHARLSDPQLTVEMIAEELNISNASLYRKVKQLTGFSTNELIKKIRLKKADVLMQRNYGSLSEIAYKVGFSSPSYFSKCYKMEFGCAPRDTK
ncbi:MAG: ATP-binding protein [Rikenellaceae bacterium]